MTCVSPTTRLLHPVAWAVILVLAAPWVSAEPTYRDPHQPIEIRIEDLLARMTLEEKVGQLCQFLGPSRLPQRSPRLTKADDASTPDSYQGLSKNDILAMVRRGEIGSFLNFYADPVNEGNELQRAAAESRLGIPLLFGADAVHGHAMTAGTTVFPAPIALAATFDEKLVESVSRVTAVEMRATGFHWAFAPNVEVARDMRWGRVNETFGEDPLLVSRLGVATVRGLQGDLSDPEANVLACAKHYIGGSQPINGQNHGPSDFSERTLREIFLPPFQACIDAGAATVMVAHNEVNGVPCHGNHYLLTEVLKKELGFTGFLVSDWLDVSRLYSLQRVAADMDAASELAALAGLDMHMHGPGYFSALVKAVKSGRVPISRIDDATGRILHAKFKAGIFERNLTEPSRRANHVATEKHTKLALEAARKSIVLLRNEDNILPLAAGVRRVFLTGPNADNTSALGDWSTTQNADRLITAKTGLSASLAARGVPLDYFNCGSIETLGAQLIAEAAKRASESDVAIIVVGGHPNRGGGPGRVTEGENVDRPDLELPGAQLQLVQAIHATGVPTVVVVQNGGPIASQWIAAHIPAILQTFYPGHQGGQALAEIVLGEVNPSGKLPYSVPRDVAHQPAYYYQRPGHFSPQGRFAGEDFNTAKFPLYEFGFGLSYTTFRYANLIAPSGAAVGQDIKLSIEVSNIGQRAGDEIVLVYVADLMSSVTQPVKLLHHFERVALTAGESRTVHITLPASAFSLLDGRLRRVVEPGEFHVLVGNQTHRLTLFPAGSEAATK